MRKLGKIMLVLLAGALLLTGCAKRYEIDAERAVDALMAAVLYGETAEYEKLTGIDQGDVVSEYNETIEEMTTVLAGYADEETLKEFSTKFLACGKYEITGFEKDEEDNYTVEIDIYSSNIVSVLLEEVLEVSMTMSDKKDVGKVLVEGLDGAVSQQSYGEPVPYQIHLTHDEEGIYEFDEDDVIQCLEAMFPIPETFVKSSGVVYDDPYLNWMKADWQAASDEEQTQCCYATLQFIGDFSDEQMAQIEVADPEIAAAVQQMKDGISITYQAPVDMSIGDYASYIKNAVAVQ